MSTEALYQAVKSGRVKMEDLNDDGVAALKGYMSSNFPDLMKQDMSREDFTKLTGVKTAIPTVNDIPAFKQMQENPLPITSYNPEPQLKSPLGIVKQNVKSALGGVKEALDAGKNFADASSNAMSFGLTNKLLRSDDEINQQKNTLSGKAGELFGDFAPIGGAYKIADIATKGILKDVPKLASTIVRGGVAGGIYGTAKEASDMALNPNGDPLTLSDLVLGKESNKKSLTDRALNIGKDAALFAAGDAALGVAGAGIKKFAGTKVGESLANLFKRKQSIAPEVDQAVNDALNAEPQATQRTVNINGNLRPANQESYINNVMTQIKPEVTSRMTPPLENPNELAKWLQPHLGETSLNEVRKLPYNDLVDLANEVRGHLSTYDVARQVAKERGYNLDNILNGKLPSITERVKQDASKRAYGIYDAPKVEISRPVKVPEIAQNTRNIEPILNANSSIPEGVQGYASNSIPFRAAGQTTNEISRNQVVNNIRKNLGVVIDTGRLSSKGKGVLGEFKVAPEVVRTRNQGDLQVISHEVGHNLDKRFGLNDPVYQQELTQFVNQVNPNHLANYNPAQHMEEAIAEYTRVRLTDPNTARQFAPNFTRFFESKLSPKALKGLESSARDISTWIDQGDYNQAKGLIDFTSGEKNGPSILSRDYWSKKYTTFVDDLNPLKLFEKSLKGVVGIGKDSIYKMARISRGISAKAELAIKRGIYDSQGNKLSDGLEDIVKPLEEIGMTEKDLATYLSVKHAKDLRDIHGKVIPFDDNQMNAVLRRWDNDPIVQDVHSRIIKFNNALTDLLVEAEILSPKAVAEMRHNYPNYVPFIRYFDDDAVSGFKNGGFGAAKSFANVSNPIKRMSQTGSTRDIVNPLESMVKNTFLVMNAAAKNKVGLQLAELSKIDGAGAWVEHVGEGGASPTEHIISVFQNGERQSYKVRNPDLYNAMLSLDAESSNSLIRFLGGAASLLRGGATLTPDFMIRNAMRDVVGNTVNSTKYGFNPLTIFNGLYHMINRDSGVMDKFLSNGGAMGTMMSLDRDLNREVLAQVFKKSIKDKAMNVVTSPAELAKMLTGYTPAKKVVGVLRKGAEVSELATRVGAFNKVLKKTGSVEEAAYTARDLMDFNRSGSAIRQANKAVAFLNASIQGLDRSARAFKENPASFLVRAFTTLVLPASALYYWNQNLPEDMKQEYQNIPQWQKDSFFIIGIPGTKTFARIPKPFEAGMLFATGTERVLQYAQNRDPSAFKNYGSSVMEALTPPVLFTALTPMLEAITNHSFFRNAPIVPQGEQNREKKDQYGTYTSETAKTIGRLVSKTSIGDTNAASPRIIDNTIKGYTAGLGNYAVSGLDKIIGMVGGGDKTPLPAKTPTEQPLAKSFFVNTSGGGQIRQDFYDRWDELTKKKNSDKFNNQQFNGGGEYNRMKSAYDVITKLNQAYKLVLNDKSMSPSEKRAKLDQMDDQMNKIAAKGLGK